MIRKDRIINCNQSGSVVVQSIVTLSLLNTKAGKQINLNIDDGMSKALLLWHCSNHPHNTAIRGDNSRT